MQPGPPRHPIGGLAPMVRHIGAFAVTTNSLLRQNETRRRQTPHALSRETQLKITMSLYSLGRVTLRLTPAPASAFHTNRAGRLGRRSCRVLARTTSPSRAHAHSAVPQNL